MLNGSALRNKKINEINAKILEQPLYKELFFIFKVDIQEDFMQAEIFLEQIDIGTHYVKINEPTVQLLDFFKNKGYYLHTLLPAYESENYNNTTIAWLMKGN